MTDSVSLPAQVRQLLETAPRESLPLTYQQLAEALGLQPPRTIQRVAQALETLMREDAQHNRPFIAALVVSRRGEGLPAQGFFDLAAELGQFSADPAQHAEAWRQEFERVVTAIK
ncbi:MoaD/ThiS family protein [Salinicola halophyticus]|uniref:MoaD/ThiS family protein n=1 Tax=Salinicola halophyticus TaxID=1808881 RepID=UPI000DA22D64|nr:MoaD/ThiS family protein [Salinicola halophyticus]